MEGNRAIARWIWAPEPSLKSRKIINKGKYIENKKYFKIDSFVSEEYVSPLYPCDNL